MRPLAALTAALVGLCGCSSKKSPPPTPSLPPLNLPAGCQPLLDGANCTLPYPSDFFRVPDATLPSGYRIDVLNAAQLTSSKGADADVDAYFPIDGASHIPTIVTYFPEAISPNGFVPLIGDPAQDSLAQSTQTSSNTLLIEADNGTLIPHYVDLDPRTPDLTRQAIVIHPIVGLKPLTRYVVAVHGVLAADGGAPVAAPEGFRRLRDGQAGTDPQLAPLAARYGSDIFAVTTQAGLKQSDLQMAWDFTVGSVDRSTDDMLQVRALTLAWLQSNTPAVTIDQIEYPPGNPGDNLEAPTADGGGIWYVVRGTVTGPLFVDSTSPPAALVRNDAGAVIQNPNQPTAPFDFVAQVPVSVRDQYGPGLPLAYGHGFFGSPDEVYYDSTVQVASTLHAVLFGVAWLGMALEDAPFVLQNLSSKPRLALNFADRVHQAMADWLVMTQAIQGPLRQQAAFLRLPDAGVGISVDGGVSNAGQPVYAAGTPSYLGISQGAILGGTMTSLDPDISRAILNVGGAGFTHMMFRAEPFANFLTFVDQSFTFIDGGAPELDSLTEQAYCATLQPQFDRFDPATYAGNIVTAPFPNSPSDRRVILQAGLGDEEVPNLGSYLYDRLMNIPVLTPSSAISPYDTTAAAAPVSGSAFTIWDFGVDAGAQYLVAEPPSSTTNNVHNDLRTTPSALAQMNAFLTSGSVIDPCGGVACTAPDK